MKQVTKINATMIALDCPACGANQEGVLDDPRGGDYQCEECGEMYGVAEDATVVLR